MIELPLVLDSDVLSSFAWVNRLDILEKLYAGKMIVLEEVINELRKIKHIGKRVESCIAKGSIVLEAMPVDAPEALELARLLERGRYGRGEAACLAYLKYNYGSLGSNNVSDVKIVCSDKNICLLTVPDIINNAVQAGIITIEEANEVWIDMINKMRKLPTKSFHEYLVALKSA